NSDLDDGLRAGGGRPAVQGSGERDSRQFPTQVPAHDGTSALFADSGVLLPPASWGGQEFGQLSFERARRLVALKDRLPSSYAPFINKRRFFRHIDGPALHILEDVGPPHDDFRLADHQN